MHATLCSQCARGSLQSSLSKSDVSCLCPIVHLPKMQAKNTDASWWGSRRRVNTVLIRGTHGRCHWNAIFSKLEQNTTPGNTSSFKGHQLAYSLVCTHLPSRDKSSRYFSTCKWRTKDSITWYGFSEQGIIDRFVCRSVTGTATTYPKAEVENEITCLKSLQFCYQ